MSVQHPRLEINQGHPHTEDPGSIVCPPPGYRGWTGGGVQDGCHGYHIWDLIYYCYVSGGWVGGGCPGHMVTSYRVRQLSNSPPMTLSKCVYIFLCGVCTSSLQLSPIRSQQYYALIVTHLMMLWSFYQKNW